MKVWQRYAHSHSQADVLPTPPIPWRFDRTQCNPTALVFETDRVFVALSMSFECKLQLTVDVRPDLLAKPQPGTHDHVLVSLLWYWLHSDADITPEMPELK